MIPHLTVLIDGGCPMCRRTARRLRAIDWLNRLTFDDGRDDAIRAKVAPGKSLSDALSGILVAPAPGGAAMGFDGFVLIARAVPLLWPVLPFVWLPPVRAIGLRVYEFIAARRRRDVCDDGTCERHASKIA